MKNVEGIILAAGFSRRMEKFKNGITIGWENI